MKETNQHDPFRVGTFVGPQTSECISVNGKGLLFKLGRKGTWWLFANSHVSHLNNGGDAFKNNSGNKCFKYPNKTCPNRLCHNQILDVDVELVTDND